MSHFGEQVVAVLTAIIGVAILAVIVSKRSNTANVISSGANAFSQALSVAVSPITGQNVMGPNGGFTGLSGSNFSLPDLHGGFSG
jgi:hypothetical protein